MRFARLQSNDGSLALDTMKIDQGSRAWESSSDSVTYDDAPIETPMSYLEHAQIIEWLSASAAALEDVHNGLDTSAALGQINGASVAASEDRDLVMNLRSYQREMFEQSMRRNVIVTMDTGTGKTRVAIMRIQAALEGCEDSKLVWFLAPKVALCVQQYDAIRKLIPAATITLLTGNEAVDTWKANVWTAVLRTTRIVISTPAILKDALAHAFLSMGHLSLLVMDEAHNAARNSPSRRIMTDFYHPRKEQGLPIPSILGLTASPSMKSTETQLFELEETLDALCISPTIHRADLLQHANRPRISSVPYAAYKEEVTSTPSIVKLNQIYRGLDIRTDPYILKLKDDPTERNLRKLQRAVESRSTWSQNQVRGLLERAKVVLNELGPWAADRYIFSNVRNLIERSGNADASFDATWLDAEKLYLTAAIGEGWANPPETPSNNQISEKCRKLISTLLMAGDNPVGIIFARDRVIVTMLKEVLSACPSIRAKYCIGTQVGANTWTGKSRELFESKEQNNSLPDFISGKVNLMIATSVLEEGIDIPACNLVICFNVPSNAKSFIQQRGRARRTKSELIIFFEDITQSHLDWEAAEAAMKRLYEDEARERMELKKVENSESLGDDVYIVPETQARLDFENAKSHLQHFCAVLARGDYLDTSPDYITQRDSVSGDLRSVVLLPSFVAPRLRRAESRRLWKSEKNATKDAAFQAYKALHQAGWLTDHLLPLRSQRIQGVETREAIVKADQLLWPWTSVARLWQEGGLRWKYPLSCFDEAGSVVGEYEIVLPIKMVPPKDITIYLDSDRRQVLHFGQVDPLSAFEGAELPDHTSTLLGLHFKHRWQLDDRSHVIQIIAKGFNLEMNGIGEHEFTGSGDRAQNRKYLVRDKEGCPMIYEGIIPSKPEIHLVQYPFYELDKAPDDVPYLYASKWTKRSDFLHPVHGAPGKDEITNKPYKRVYPVPWARVDSIPIRHAEFGMLIPSIIHELEIMLLIQTLSTTVLADVQISNMELIREAISSRSASEPYHYERLEFLGDSILKYCTSVQLSADHTEWPEGYLSFAKDCLVANSRLSRAALETGLAKFILTKPFTGQKWRPLYLVEALEHKEEPDTRSLSTKTLADVVEALIGASFADGGLTKALQCISAFIYEPNWRDVSSGRDILLRAARPDDKKLGVVAPVQELIGHNFSRTSLLLEALTHASYISDSDVRSLERLEFLGDAILDYIVVTRLYKAEPKLTHGQMHMLKTALVNGDFLAFIALERRNRTVQDIGTTDGEIEAHEVERPLWMFMRHTSPAIVEEQKATAKRYEKMRDEVKWAITHGTHYPWALLARLQTKKFYSDLIEALLGAVWVDSGTIEQCEVMLTQLGILPYLDRMLRDNVHVQHPKEELTKAAVAETIKYAIDVREGENGEKEWLCKIYLGSRMIADVEGGVSKEEVRTKAAAEALVFLNMERALDG